MLVDTFSIKANLDNNSDSSSVPLSLPTGFVFYIFLLLDIPSVVCSFVLFYYFIRLRELRDEHQSNEVIIYLLIGTFLVTSIDIPLMLPYLHNYYYIGTFKYRNSFCMFWIMYDYGMYSINLWLMSLVCLERYLLIFFKQFIIRNRKRRLFLYYVPVTFIILFVFFWYLYLIVLYPCEQIQFDFTQVLCGFPCYKTVGSIIVQNTDWALADLLPLFLSIFFILLLITHVLYQKQKISRRLIQQNIWKRTRKMFLQLLPVIFIFLVFNLPLIIVGLLAISNPWYNTIPYFYVNSLSYCLALFMPFAVLSKQTIIRKRISTFLRLRPANRTGMMTITVHPMRLLNTQASRKALAPTVMNSAI